MRWASTVSGPGPSVAFVPTLIAAARNADLRESKANVNESEHARNIIGKRQGTESIGVVPSS